LSLVSRRFSLAFATLVLGALTACSSNEPRQERDTSHDKTDAEVRDLKAQLDESAKARRDAEARVEDVKRELERKQKELAASRETTVAAQNEARLSLQMIQAQRDRYEKRLEAIYSATSSNSKTAPADGQEAAVSSSSASGPMTGSSIARIEPIDPDQPVALVDGEPVSRRELMEWLYANEALSQLDTYLNFVLVHREAKRLGVEVTKDEAENAALEQLALASKQAGGDDALDKMLAEKNLNRESLLDVLRANARSTALVTRLCRYRRETKEGKERLEAKAREVFETSFGEKVEARHLFIQVAPGTSDEEWSGILDLAKKTRAQLAAGEDWATVAKNLQMNKHRAVFKREFYSKGQIMGVAELEKTLFGGGVADKELSEPIRWKGGVSILLVENRIPSKVTFEEKRDLLMKDLDKPEIQPEEPELLYQELRAKAKIEKKLELPR
jgi:hypothetical protein